MLATLSACPVIPILHHPSVTSARRKAIALTTCALFGIGVGLFLFGDWERQPHYQGRSLSAWLAISDQQDDLQSAKAAEHAVLQIGTNALPCLLKWIQYEWPAWRTPLWRVLPGRVWNNGYFQGLIEGRSGRRCMYGILGFAILGTNAVSALPELEALMKDRTAPDTARNAIAAISNLGEPALPVLGRALADTNQVDRFEIIACLRAMATYHGPAAFLPLLRQSLTNDDEAVRVMATNSLRAIAQEQPTE